MKQEHAESILRRVTLISIRYPVQSSKTFVDVTKRTVLSQENTEYDRPSREEVERKLKFEVGRAEMMEENLKKKDNRVGSRSRSYLLTLSAKPYHIVPESFNFLNTTSHWQEMSLAQEAQRADSDTAFSNIPIM